MTKLTVKLNHKSSIPGARWCTPVGWEPTNEIAGAEFLDGSWWGESQEEAGVICFADGDEGGEIEVEVDELRIAACGDCRVIGALELAE